MYFPLGIFSIASYVGTNHGIGWNKIESLLLRCWGEKVRLEFCQGSLRKLWNQLDPVVVAIRKAMLMCYTVDPMKFPSSKAVATFLDVEFKHL
jgi:hypothetical protein